MLFALGGEFKLNNITTFAQITNRISLIKTISEINDRFFDVGFEAGVRLELSEISAIRNQMKETKKVKKERRVIKRNSKQSTHE